jgi:hypothetical protein
LGAYCVIRFRDGDWTYIEMDREELDRVQQQSPMGRRTDEAPDGKGPWRDWPDEMRKAKVTRRALKLYADDPGILRMIEIADRQFEDDGPTLPELPVGQNVSVGYRAKLERAEGNGRVTEPSESVPSSSQEPSTPAPAPESPLDWQMEQDRVLNAQRGAGSESAPSEEDMARDDMTDQFVQAFAHAADLHRIEIAKRQVVEQSEWLGPARSRKIWQAAEQAERRFQREPGLGDE